ncbi:MAG: aminopeptidase P family protein [Fimbriimonadaceae bacterium]|nr:aminopeptidase P family protein [Fimbriimonadaceae bacterium]
MSNLLRLQAALSTTECPAVVLTDMNNVRWVSGFTGSFGQAWVTQNRAAFVTDSRYAIQAAEQVEGFDLNVFAAPKNLTETMTEVVANLALNSVMFETSLSVATWTEWKAKFPGLTLVPAEDLMKPLRMVKTEDDVRRIQEACRLADACMSHARRMLQPGVTEYDVGLDIEFYFRRNGAEVGFSPIVASGPNSARPHATPGERKFEVGDFVTLDLGGRLDGYCSDITRTFVIGKASDRHREVYEAVLAAEQAAIAAIRPGMTGKEVDAVARDLLANQGLAQYFGHGLGHGLGLQVHDPGGLSTRSTDKIEVGQVWTIEPGVYIEGFGGVRIEDDVLVTKDGAQVLTHVDRSLQELT